MSIILSAEAVDLLLICCELGHWHVTDTNIPDVGDLIRQGFITAIGDYDTISIFITDKGREYAAGQKWIEPFPDAIYEPWTRTELGKQASNYIQNRP